MYLASSASGRVIHLGVAVLVEEVQNYPQAAQSSSENQIEILNQSESVRCDVSS